MDTALQRFKQIASHSGGTRNGLVLSRPQRIKTAGEVRTPFHQVIDIAPKLLDVPGLAPPTVVHGVPQQPLAGASLDHSFGHAHVP
jgi:arylsulfatase A-like enzyme